MKLFINSQFVFNDQKQFVPEVGTWPSRLQVSLARLGAAWMARRKRARDVRELQMFSDRELWDVGLGRSDLPAISSGIYRRD